MWYSFRPYVSVAKRRAQAAREVDKRKKKGQTISPINIVGRTIANTFWGKAWCENLESYSDYENRLPRGRTYVRNGSVVDLQIQPGKVTALVSGSSLYTVAVAIDPLPDAHWRGIKSRCAGEFGSLVELLQGKLSKGVMDVVTAQEAGLFPKPREIKLSCSCPDWAGMCKHVAAVMYGVGSRLDEQPELLFLLRKVDHLELIDEAVPQSTKKASSGKKTLAQSDVASVFGIELTDPDAADALPSSPRKPASSKLRMDKSSATAAPKLRKGGKHAAVGKSPPPKGKTAAKRSRKALVNADGD